MQDKELTKGFLLLAVPADMLEESGLCEGELIQITAGRKKIVIEAVEDTGELVCDRDCESCPIYETKGENCPNKNDQCEGGTV